MRRPPGALREFLAAYDPSIARLFLAVRGAVLGAAPDANELVYDAYNTVSAVYSYTERMRDAFCHVAAYRDYVNLGFNRGAALPDPQRLLVGSGASIRHVRIRAAADLAHPGVQALLRAAVGEGRRDRPAAAGAGRSLVKSVSAAKRRPPGPASVRPGRSR